MSGDTLPALTIYIFLAVYFEAISPLLNFSLTMFFSHVGRNHEVSMMPVSSAIYKLYLTTFITIVGAHLVDMGTEYSIFWLKAYRLIEIYIYDI